MDLYLGRTVSENRAVWLDSNDLDTHLHIFGATGTGKSTAILSLLRSLMLRTHGEEACIFLIDPMGGLSRDVLALLAHPRWSTPAVRRRLVYIEPSNVEGIVTPFNPLGGSSDATRHYQVIRAIEVVLRGFDAQSLRTQPRLYRWLFNAFYSAAEIGFPIAMCRYLLQPGTGEHAAMLRGMPPELRYEWEQVLQSNRASVEHLDSTRNRLQPFFNSPSLRRMFGCEQSRFDCERWIRERRIVVLNLAKHGRLTGPDGQTIGALALNEIFETAYRVATTEGRDAVAPTYVIADEFQKFVGPDLVETIPTSRQIGIRCILANQSWAQLQKEDCDLTDLIWQVRSRFLFNNAGADADLVADEIAKRTYEPGLIKEQRYALRQLIVGYRKEWLSNYSQGRTTSQAESSSLSHSHQLGGGLLGAEGSGSSSQSTGTSASRVDGSGSSSGKSEANVPIHRTFRELSSISYKDLDEQTAELYRRVRELKTGEAFLQRRSATEVPLIKLDAVPIVDTAEIRDAVAELKARNYESEFFISAAQADREAEELRHRLLTTTITLPSSVRQRAIDVQPTEPMGGDGAAPFSL